MNKWQLHWYKTSLTGLMRLLLPFSWLFGLVVYIRKQLYRRGLLTSYGVSVPVIVVGNITVGGTGKTPFVIWLADYLRAKGYRPGIVSRGYGAEKQDQPYSVTPDSMVSEAGDEPLMLLKRTGCPVVTHPNRVKAAQALLARFPACNIIISDDGLQHYRLQRQIEIAIVDGARRYGNQHLLPSGPLREPVSRLQSVDFVVVKEGQPTDAYCFNLVPERLMAVIPNDRCATLADFKNQTVHAVAGIGYPERFFSLLEAANMTVIRHAFADHHVFTRDDIHFEDLYPVLMTEKDAVKCAGFADQRCWYLTVSAVPDQAFCTALLSKLTSLEAHSENDFSKRACGMHR